MSEYERKFQAAMGELIQAGVWRLNANPPYVRLMRKLGFKPRPPHYVPFSRVAISEGIWMACAFGLVSWLLDWHPDLHLNIAVVISVMVGAFFGIFMAFDYYATRKKYKLNNWQSL
jgi:hypothetical protein